jgi:hypothetical protein
MAAATSYSQEQFVANGVERGFAALYNLRFPEAHRQFEAWGKAHPDDPRTPVFQAAADLFDEFNRLHILQSEFLTNDDNFLFPKRLAADPVLRERMLNNFSKAKQMADAELRHDPNNADALMAEVLRSGLYANYLALIAKRDTAALAEIKQGTAWADRLLAVHPDIYDAYLASGVENYLLSQKVAPVRWLLRLGGAQTDRDKGLHDLRIVAEKGHYLKPYAQLLLAIAALRADDKTQARKLLTSLAERYPENPLYRRELEKIRG